MSGWQSGKKKTKEPKELPKREDFFKRGKDLVHTQGLKIMVWGPTSVGKTHFAMSAPSPIFILDLINREYGDHIFHLKSKRLFYRLLIGTINNYNKDTDAK